MIKTIIFDLAEVYLNGFLGAEHRIGKLLEIEDKIIYEKMHIPELTLLFNGKISEEQYWKKVIENTKWNIDIQK